MAKVRIDKKIVQDQLYLYFNGHLVYKRWLTQDKGRMFYADEALQGVHKPFNKLTF